MNPCNAFSFFQKCIDNNDADSVSARHHSDTINYVNTISRIKERKLSTCFNILYNECPESLTQYMYLAAVYDKEMFNDFLKMDHEFFLKKSELLRFTESPICAVSRISKVSEKELIDTLISQICNPATFISEIVNTKSNTPLKVIESILQLKCNLDSGIFKAVSGIHNGHDFISQILYQAGCSLALNYKLSRKSKKHLSEMYDSNDDTAIPSASPVKNQSLTYIARRLSKFRESNSSMMIMLSFYNICFKVLKNNDMYGLYHVDELNKDKVSVPLAAGAYITARKLYKKANAFFNANQNIENEEQENRLPSFDEYFAFLQSYIKGEIKIVICSHCGSPYFNIYESQCKDLNCPCCNHNCYYFVEDITQRQMSI